MPRSVAMYIRVCVCVCVRVHVGGIAIDSYIHTYHVANDEIWTIVLQIE